MGLSSNVILIICIIIITLTNIFIALTIGLVLIRISNIMLQVEKFLQTINKLFLSGTGFFGAIIGALLGLNSKKDKGGY